MTAERRPEELDRLEYAPGTASLRCPYCGHLQDVPATTDVVEEHSYDAWAALPTLRSSSFEA